ncbi:unnamed protein product [Hyaloperonospora brassicae]|uniref:Chromatin modification-related protein MEAF6 n=1 Tax=Hyaloperonospora brassicae TaxID=162125 RepID=A0AAV0U8L5_HYABA|nr:unnamed protein product [Hyaloperonospora brassicae]
MRALYEAQRRAHETVLALQAQIEDEEAMYLDETPHGNIIRGWDGFIDSKQPRKDTSVRKLRPYTESEHLFSSSCFYASMASEPSLDDVADIYGTSKDESGHLRKLTVTLSMGKGTGVSGSISGVVDSTASAVNTTTASGDRSHADGLMHKTGKTVAHVATEKGGGAAAAALSYRQSKASKLKKRKREVETDASAFAAAAAVVGSLQKTAVTADVITGAASAGTTAVPHEPPASDFLDVL